MPVIYRGGGGSSRRGGAYSERTYYVAMDWVRRIMQLAALATIVLYGYLLYGLLSGDVSQWATLTHADRVRIIANVQMAVHYLNIVLGILLVSACILYYDEEPMGYLLIGGSVALYYGVPFLIGFFMDSQLHAWQQSKNLAALSIYQQFSTAAFMLAIPGVILVVRDLIMRVIDSAVRRRERYESMEYGANVKEETRQGGPMIGVFAKCWQLPFCRDAIRNRCPIFQARTKCWKERVGCMCEENVIRHAMDGLIHKELITTESAITPAIGDKPLIEGLESQPVAQKTEEFLRPEEAPAPPPREVKIPQNPHLPMSVKRERCRNCVIYNEHQRMKYQFVAPVLVLGVPALAVWQLDVIKSLLHQLLAGADKIMSSLSFSANPKSLGIEQGINSTGVVAEYLIIGCVVVILTSFALRFLEYLVFKLKI